MPASSISPYMWIVSGPTSSVPLDGDGREARSRIGLRFCPSPRWPAAGPLGQDLHRELDAAPAAEEVDRVVQVDVVPQRQLEGLGGGVPRPLQLLGAPAVDPLALALDLRLSRSHGVRPRLVHGGVPSIRLKTTNGRAHTGGFARINENLTT